MTLARAARNDVLLFLTAVLQGSPETPYEVAHLPLLRGSDLEFVVNWLPIKSNHYGHRKPMVLSSVNIGQMPHVA